jgi:hypothetical protein
MTTIDDLELEAPPFEKDGERPNCTDLGGASETEARDHRALIAGCCSAARMVVQSVQFC